MSAGTFRFLRIFFYTIPSIHYAIFAVLYGGCHRHVCRILVTNFSPKIQAVNKHKFHWAVNTDQKPITISREKSTFNLSKSKLPSNFCLRQLRANWARARPCKTEQLVKEGAPMHCLKKERAFFTSLYGLASARVLLRLLLCIGGAGRNSSSCANSAVFSACRYRPAWPDLPSCIRRAELKQPISTVCWYLEHSISLLKLKCVLLLWNRLELSSCTISEN